MITDMSKSLPAFLQCCPSQVVIADCILSKDVEDVSQALVLDGL